MAPASLPLGRQKSVSLPTAHICTAHARVEGDPLIHLSLAAVFFLVYSETSMKASDYSTPHPSLRGHSAALHWVPVALLTSTALD